MKKQALSYLLVFFSIHLFAQEIPRTVCTNCWNPDSLGNHRVVLEYDGGAKIAKAAIIWKRRDDHPELKRIIVEDAATHQKVMNVKTGEINDVFGNIFFEPVSGKGIYYVYYMPYKNEGRSNYPKGVYLSPENTASPDWIKSFSDTNMAMATVKEIQSIDSFNTFYPMEVIAAPFETDRLAMESKEKDFLIFPEDRLHSIRMKYNLPERWIEKGIKTSFTDTAMRGENFAYQLGIFALQDIKNIRLNFSDLESSSGKIISAKNISCLYIAS